jgi:hypothetical protein
MNSSKSTAPEPSVSISSTMVLTSLRLTCIPSSSISSFTCTRASHSSECRLRSNAWRDYCCFLPVGALPHLLHVHSKKDGVIRRGQGLQGQTAERMLWQGDTARASMQHATGRGTPQLL